jgi:SAM-dependent methyltransferase
MADRNVVFDDATVYERFMGRWSRAVGEKFLTWLDPPRGQKWLDVGCGTGAFSQLIMDQCAPSLLVGVDPAPAQIEYARKALPQVEFRVGDALAIPFDSGAFDIAASALVLHFLPDRAKAFEEMRRVLVSNGMVAGYTWNRTPESTFAPYAPMARVIKAMGLPLSLSPLVPEAAPEGLRSTLDKAGLRDIVIDLIEATQSYRDFDEYWEIQTLPFHPIGKTVAGFSDSDRAKLRASMHDALSPGSDGRVSYSARAIVFRARNGG